MCVVYQSRTVHVTQCDIVVSVCWCNESCRLSVNSSPVYQVGPSFTVSEYLKSGHRAVGSSGLLVSAVTDSVIVGTVV